MAACGFPRPNNVAVVGGQVSGLWDGTDGVALRLQADSVDTLITVSSDGPFNFAERLAQGASYTVTVATNPAKHACIVDAGGNGLVGDADVTNISITCTGPEVAIALSGEWGARFDPSRESQTFHGSFIAQEVTLTISGSSLTGATVGNAPATLGKATAPIALPLGITTLQVALSASGALSKTYQLAFERGVSLLEQAVYVKASNTGQSDLFGSFVALSGNTLVVGAPGEASNATGVNSDQNSDSAADAGAVYVFVYDGMVWSQQAYIKASNTDAGDQFGARVALSGETLAVSAPREDSSTTGVSLTTAGANNLATDSGAVYIFVRNGTTWTQQAYLKASNTGAGDLFGTTLALFGDTLVVGAPVEDSNGVGVNGTQTNDLASDSGAAYVFVRNGDTWTQQAYLKASNTAANAIFGTAVAVYGDTVAVGSQNEASIATGINGDQSNSAASGAGATYVFVRNGTTWTQQAYVKASNTQANSHFGNSVALSGDTLAVGALNEASNAIGVNPTNVQVDGATNSGAAYVFVRSGITWAQQAYIKASNTARDDWFGFSLALAGDTLAVAAWREASSATGINGDQSNDLALGAGAVYVFTRRATTWNQQAYVKASNTGAGDEFGFSIALSGNYVAIGARAEASAATGINRAGGQADNSVHLAGAVYLYR